MRAIVSEPDTSCPAIIETKTDIISKWVEDETKRAVDQGLKCRAVVKLTDDWSLDSWPEDEIHGQDEELDPMGGSLHPSQYGSIVDFRTTVVRKAHRAQIVHQAATLSINRFLLVLSSRHKIIRVVDVFVTSSFISSYKMLIKYIREKALPWAFVDPKEYPKFDSETLGYSDSNEE